MAQPVVSLGATLVTAVGCVWYLPAFADLRAGADLPYSRTAAAACLTGWTTLAVIVVLLLYGVPWQATCVMAAAGATVTVALPIRAAAQHHHEARKLTRHWATPAPGLPQHSRSHAPSRFAVAALLGCGLVGATVTVRYALDERAHPAVLHHEVVSRRSS
ncbi:hypothetical protein IOD14_22375 [Streptomyces sp. A2-16]|uniref:hypothetical protein n=1 Tax=Streptomyces sp. A2-16 TaxID=2781734 RepID=UPI001BAFADA4|nr:hypothetical protein [Streptomyces sp. A2-16]QUC59279.1 hypothetical protein IOD14_22375 [Streptomyces sp. A2-16]